MGSSILRGPCLCRRYSTGCSLNSHIPAITCKDRPSNPRQLVCQGYGHDVAMCSRKQSLSHWPSGRSFLARPGRAVRTPWHPQITVAALADARQPRFSTCRRLARHQSQPSCQVTATAEFPTAATRAVAVSTPIPGILVNRLAASSLCTRSASSSLYPLIRWSMLRHSSRTSSMSRRSAVQDRCARPPISPANTARACVAPAAQCHAPA